MFVEPITANLGRITIYGAESSAASSTATGRQDDSKALLTYDYRTLRKQILSAGTIPPASSALDHRDPLSKDPVAGGGLGHGNNSFRLGALTVVETRPSVLIARLFAERENYAIGVEYILLSIVIRVRDQSGRWRCSLEPS